MSFILYSQINPYSFILVENLKGFTGHAQGKKESIRANLKP